MNAPLYLLPWLYAVSAVTPQLESHMQEAHVQVIQQQWAQPNWWEVYHLNIMQSVFRRDVLILSHHMAYWFARTIIPKKSYEAHADLFDRLKKEPLTQLIFNNPQITRLSMTITRINKQYLAYYWIPEAERKKSDHFWMRCAQYQFKNGDRFYVIEIFFPSLRNVHQLKEDS